jgi:CDP-diacylglycerol--glycerol-3-phosphate 3-phosphatidyltransferase
MASRPSLNLPNRITLLRLPLAALFFISFFDQPLPYFFPELKQPTPYHHTIAFFCFLVACLTDWCDGFLARRYNQVTVFGALWDPVADKILVTSAWITLVANHAMPAWIVVLLLARDFTVTGLRMTAGQQGIALSAETGGKIKTVVQLITIGVLCAHYSLIEDWGFKSLSRPGYAYYEIWILYPACVITSLWSAWSYFRKNWKLLRI